MKYMGFCLVIVSFLGGALVSTYDQTQTSWILYLLALGLGILGVVLLKLHKGQQQGSVEVHTGNIQMLTRCLQHIVDNLTELTAEYDLKTPVPVHDQIDTLFTEDLNNFVEARNSITHVYGLQAYADTMSSFAAAERYLNRVWSASVDGYIDEVQTYLSRAQEQFKDSLQRLQALSTN